MKTVCVIGLMINKPDDMSERDFAIEAERLTTEWRKAMDPKWGAKERDIELDEEED